MNILSKSALALAIAISAATLTGCEPMDDPEATKADEADIDSQSRTKMAQEERELKEELAKLQAKDPAIKDMYYSYSEEGDKQVHIIRETRDEKTGETRMADTMMPMMAGMMLGQMMASNMMMTSMMMANAGGYRNTTYHSPSQYRERRNMATSSYVRGTRSNVSKSFVSSRPTSSYSTRSQGAFSSSSSARSSGYSAGG